MGSQLNQRGIADLRVLDAEVSEHCVRFYLGTEKTYQEGKFHGNDWNDSPFDCNAGTIYPVYCKAILDIYFEWDTVVRDAPPVSGPIYWSKNDIKAKRYALVYVEKEDEPCIQVMIGDLVPDFLAKLLPLSVYSSWNRKEGQNEC